MAILLWGIHDYFVMYSLFHRMPSIMRGGECQRLNPWCISYDSIYEIQMEPMSQRILICLVKTLRPKSAHRPRDTDVLWRRLLFKPRSTGGEVQCFIVCLFSGNPPWKTIAPHLLPACCHARRQCWLLLIFHSFPRKTWATCGGLFNFKLGPQFKNRPQFPHSHTKIS